MIITRNPDKTNFILKTIPEAYLERSQTSTMEVFLGI